MERDIHYLSPSSPEVFAVCNCLTCKHCLPPSRREDGMCNLSECKYEEVK